MQTINDTNLLQQIKELDNKINIIMQYFGIGKVSPATILELKRRAEMEARIVLTEKEK